MRIWDRWRLAGRVGRWVGVLCLGLALGVPSGAQEPVGRIEGDDITVKGQVTLMRAGTRKSAELASGSEVSVRTGQARLTLNDGSEIDICGPAQFTVLRSGDAVTVALNHGRLHGRFSPTLPVTIYTPLVVFTPIAIEGRPRDSGRSSRYRTIAPSARPAASGRSPARCAGGPCRARCAPRASRTRPTSRRSWHSASGGSPLSGSSG